MEEAVHVFATVHAVTLGFTSLELARRRALPAPRASAASTSIDPTSPHYWPAFFSTLPADRYPYLTSVRPDLAAFTSPERFREVIGSILAGAAPGGPATGEESS
jgi:hypothetical protein